MPRITRSAGWVLAVLLPLAVGCGPQQGSAVSGVVRVNGQPAAGAMVVLSPAANPKSMDKKPIGIAGADGKFTLNTMTDSDGVTPGEYLVSITWPGKPKGGTPKGLGGGDDERATSTDQLGGRYSDPATSGLKATIKVGANDLPPFDLK